MNGRFKMQGGKNWIFPKEMNANQFFWDSHLAGNLVKPLISLSGTDWRERGYGLWTLRPYFVEQGLCSFVLYTTVYKL
jgi:hypothetical protein